MPQFTHDWGSKNFPVWKTILEKLAGKPNLLFLEIGCYEGLATLWLLENILTQPTSAILVMDTFAGSMEMENIAVGSMERTFRRNIARYRKQVRIKKGVSQVLLRGLKAEFDFVYIDGSHQAADVLEDAVLSFRLLKPGGILIFDDYLWRNYPQPQLNPALGIDSFLAGFAGRYNLLHKNYQVAIKKLAIDLPAQREVGGKTP